MKHKHADLIHAWADGAEIQIKMEDGEWWENINGLFLWDESCEYRIKPEEKKPVVRWLWADADGFVNCLFRSDEEAKNNSGYAVKLEWSRTEFPE